MPKFRPRIAIVGAGPGGLALGQLLCKRGIRPTIYELRGKPTQEELAKPSGMLDLHDESGKKAIQECGLWDDCQAAMGDCSESARVLNPQGVVLHTDEGELSSRPEIARNKLSDLFLRNVPSDVIKWHQKLKAVRSERNKATGATEIKLDFSTNETATYDFVVGADGAWSRVRRLLTDTRPFYTGAQFLTATMSHVSTKYPHLLKITGSGTLNAMGRGNAIMTHRGPQDSVRMYAVASTPQENWAEATGLKGKTAAQVKDVLLDNDSIFGSWAPELQELLLLVCEEETKDNPGSEADIKPSYMLPVGHRWDHQICATLVGDAAHLMTPWGGEGVNLALWDSLDLAGVFEGVPEAEDAATWQALLDPRVREFEDDMLARAQSKAEETDSNRQLFLSEFGGERMAEFFQAAYGTLEEAREVEPVV